MTAQGMELRLKWVGEYHGPSPLAAGPVVVAELSADVMPEPERLAWARAQWWVQSGVTALDNEPELGLAIDDALLGVGETAVRGAQAALNEVRGFVQHAGAVRSGNAVRLWLGFHHPPVSRAALQLALKSLAKLLEGEFTPSIFRAELEQLWQACRRYHPDYQARILMVGAREMCVPFLPFLPDSRYWQFGWGSKGRVFFESSSNEDGALGAKWQRDKTTAKALMMALGMPTPAHRVVHQPDELVTAVQQQGFPCVIKPVDAGGGKGVTANILSLADAKAAFALAYRYRPGPVMVETHVHGYDHRLMVIEGQLVAVIRREPSYVVGDGRQTIAQLVTALNATRSSNIVHSRYLRPIVVDAVVEQHLVTQSLVPSDVLALGQRVTLRSNANLSTGGLCTDVTARCHPQVRAMAEQLAETAGLTTIGIDYLTTDITRAPSETGGAFIEMNTTPGLDACVAAGWAEAEIARLVLGTEVGRIPVTLKVVGDATLSQECSKGLSVSLKDDEGWLCGDDLRVGAAHLRNTSLQPWAAVQAALRNQRLIRLQVVCTSSDIQRYGLPVDRFEHVQLDSALLPEPWLDLLKRVSKHGVTFSQSMHKPSPIR